MPDIHLCAKLIELVKAEFFTNKGLYGRNAYFFCNEVEAVTWHYNFLGSVYSWPKRKTGNRRIISIAVDSYSEKALPELPTLLHKLPVAFLRLM
jgi:hypothetical protein